jgi:hypothetical protein
MVATLCGRMRASAFVQGYFNPAGGGATATPANLDVTSSGGNSASVIPQLLADSTNVVDLLHAMWTSSRCVNPGVAWWTNQLPLPRGRLTLYIWTAHLRWPQPESQTRFLLGRAAPRRPPRVDD